MGIRLDVQKAIANATIWFRKFPLQFCFPMVACGTVTVAFQTISYRLLGRSVAAWVGLIILLGCITVTYFAEISVAAMYLGCRNGQRPHIAQAKRAVGYDGIWRVVSGLLLRYIGWGAVAGMCLAGVAFIWLIVTAAIYGLASPARSGAMPAAVSWTVGFELVLAVLLSRYLFVVPTVVILRGNIGRYIIQQTASRTKIVRWTAILGVAEIAPGVMLYLLTRVLWPAARPYAGARLVADLVVSVLTGCYFGWFVLVRTELAGQLLEQLPLPPRKPGGVEDGLGS